MASSRSGHAARTAGAPTAVPPRVPERPGWNADAAALRAVGELLASSTPPGELAAALLGVVRARFGWRLAALWRVDRTGGLERVHVVGAVRAGTAGLEATRLDPATSGLRARAAASGRVQVRRHLDRTHVEARAAGVGWAKAFPLLVAGRVVGVLEGLGRERPAPSRTGRALVETVVAGLARLERSPTAVPERDGQRLLERILEAGPDAVYVHDLDQDRIVYASPSVRERFGYSPEGLRALGPSTRDFLVHPDDLPVSDAALRQLRRAADGQVVEAEHRFRHACGEWRWVRTRQVVFDREAGRVRRVIGVVEDVTRARRDRERAQQTQQYLQALLENVDDGLMVVDDERRLVGLNRAFAQLMGSDPEMLLDRTLAELSAPSHVERIEWEWAEFIRAGRRSGEWAFRRADGSRLDVEYRAVAGAVPGRHVAVVRDVSERRRTLESLRQSEERYRSVVAALQEGIMVLDAAGRIQACNASAARILGRAESELIGRTPADEAWAAIDEDGTPTSPAEHPVTLTLQDGAARSGSLIGLHRPDGTLAWISINCEPLRLPDEPQPHGVVVSFADISEQRAAQSGLRRLSGLLLRSQDEERRRIARELHDSTAQTVAALEMQLGAAARLLDRPSAPVASALAESRRLAAEAGREVRSLSYLLHPPLLDETGLASALRWYCDGVTSRTLLEVGLDLPTSLPRLPREVETALFRIAQEGLTNVHRHAHTRHVRVCVRVGHGMVMLSVEDEGDGIAAERLARLRTDTGTLGIGIAGMRERLRQLGGQLTIDSGPTGTRLTAHVPVPPDEAA